MNADDLDRWALDVMQSELAQRQGNGVLADRDRSGHPAHNQRAGERRSLAA